MNIIVEDSARDKIKAKNADTVHCMLNMCASWGGTTLDPAVYVGTPRNIDHFNKFENNGITVYVKKGTPSVNGTLTITVGAFLWFEKLMVEGMI